jgi:bifunctional dethiobiotin synthetase / adenosylmethionine---8-amino-7-oxononanoate aminotransferase
VHSPGPSGTSQAELYKPLRCPVILIGDSKLGGISLTISSYESLTLRGYDVEAIVLFKDDKYQNYDYLTKYFKDHHNVPVYSIEPPPPRASSAESDKQAMLEYYRQTSQSPIISTILDTLETQHHARINRLESMTSSAHKNIWYPFTQQKHLQPSSITTIDSACGDHFQTLAPASSTPSDPTQPLLWPTFDASASWWTQGLGHASTALTLAAAHAAGRYGHVMFADCAHAPALELAEALLAGACSPRLTRVFYSDDGSTGAEVAVKMALRAARVRYGGGGGSGGSGEGKLGVIGLKGGYHGDTIGAMDCAEPGVFNEKVEWYEGRGMWLDSPTVLCQHGKWIVTVPEGTGESMTFKELGDIFDIEAREARGDHKGYEAFVEKALKQHIANGGKYGAVLVEPVILGAGGMALV